MTVRPAVGLSRLWQATGNCACPEWTMTPLLPFCLVYHHSAEDPCVCLTSALTPALFIPLFMCAHACTFSSPTPCIVGGLQGSPCVAPTPSLGFPDHGTVLDYAAPKSRAAGPGAPGSQHLTD